MITIDGKQVVFSETFIVRDSSTVTIETVIDKIPFIVDLHFNMKDDNTEAGISWKGEGDRLKIEVQSWKNPLGTTLIKPHKLGEFNGKSLGFQIFQKFINGINLVHFQVYLGGSYE